MKKALLFGLVAAFVLISQAPAGALCVNVSEANLRGGPGTNYERTWEVFRYMPLQKLRKKGRWYRVRDVDGDIHWIYDKLVTEEFRCGVVKVPEAHIRSGPGTRYEETAASPALRYYSFRIIKTQPGWAEVRDEYGVTGWIAMELLWVQ